MTAEADLMRRESALRVASPYAWSIYGVFCLTLALVNATSGWMKQIDGKLWPQLVDELTSVSTIFVLTPAVVLVVLHLRRMRANWLQTTGAHVLGFVAFSGSHVVGMVLLRRAIYPLFGSYYAGDRNVLHSMIYEGRKDALVYLCLALSTHMIVRLFQRESLPPSAALNRPAAVRIRHRDGAMQNLIPADEILWVEAAGNYVELVLPSRRLLQRQSLRAVEAELAAAGFVRIHRSRIVNPAHIRSLVSKGNGDFTLVLANNLQITGSRRFRQFLKAKLVG